MTVNNPPFSPIVRIYPGANPTDPDTWGAGQDVSSYVRHPGSDGGAPISYSVGRPDEASTVDPGRMTLTLDNRDGRFTTRNPNGAYYPDLRRNTPIVLSMYSGTDDFSRTVSNGLGTSSGGGVWTSSTIWSANGTYGKAAIPTANFASAPLLAGTNARNVDVRMTYWPTVAATGAALIYGITLRATDSQNTLLLTQEFGPAGAMDVKIRAIVANVYTTLATGSPVGSYVANDKWRMRAQVIGNHVRLKVWKPANPSLPDADEPDAWTLSTTDTTVTGTQVGLFFWRLSGNTNVGTVDFPLDDFAAEAVEFSGSVTEWPVRWDMKGGNCWAPIVANGVLRRIRQAGIQLQSPLRRQLPSYSPTAYWPLEDGSGATVFGSAVSGGQPATFTSVNPGSDSTLPGASVAPVMSGTSARIVAPGGARQTGNGYALMFFMKFATATPAGDTVIAYWPQEQSGSNAITNWEIWIQTSGTVLNLRGWNDVGTLIVNSTAAISGLSGFDSWIAWQFEIDNPTPATNSVSLIYHEVGAQTFYSLSTTYANTSKPKCTGAVLGGDQCDDAAYSHLWIGENTLPFVDVGFSLVSNGYAGEEASDRIARLCDEQGIISDVEPGTSDPLGPQRVGGFLDAIYDAANADYGLLYESGVGIGYRPRSVRYAQSVALALAVADGDISEPPEPTDDDQRVVNDFTASRVDGSSARVYDQTHIDEQGLYTGSASLLTYDDSNLDDHAGWRVYLGTRPDLRWPSIRMNFARTPENLPSWRAAGFAPRVTVTTGRSQVTESDPDVIVEGYSATLSPAEWQVDCSCSPATPWDVTTLGNATPVRLDTSGSTLNSSVTTTGTSWTVVTASGPIWVPTSSYPAEVPFTIVCEGEECSVTNVGDLSGGTQVLTVTRSTNGIVKAHASGAALSLAVPTYLAL